MISADDPMATYPFDPDWCLAPAATLDEWMVEHKLSVRTAAIVAAPHIQLQSTMRILQEVLERKPLAPVHVSMLHRMTGISVQVWTGLEVAYRDGLRRGLTDTTGELESWPPRAASDA